MAFKTKGTYYYVSKSGLVNEWGTLASRPAMWNVLRSGGTNHNVNNGYSQHYTAAIGNGYFGLPVSGGSMSNGIVDVTAPAGALGAPHRLQYCFEQGTSTTPMAGNKWYYFHSEMNYSSWNFSEMVGSEQTVIDCRMARDSNSTNGANNIGGFYWINPYASHATYGRQQMKFTNIIISNWFKKSAMANVYQNAAIIPGNRHFEFENCKFLNCDLYSDYSWGQSTTSGYPMLYYNCLFVNCNSRSRMPYKMNHCTLINSKVGNRFDLDIPYFDRHSIMNCFFDENSEFEFGTVATEYTNTYVFESNIFKGKINVRRQGGNTISTQYNPTGVTWATSVAANGSSSGVKTYDFRGVDGQKTRNNFLYEPDHFYWYCGPQGGDANADGAAGGIGNATAIYDPTIFSGTTNTDYFNMKDSGSLNTGFTDTNRVRGDIVIDYTLKTGSTVPLDVFKTGATDGFPIGYYGVANSYNATDTSVWPANQYVNVIASSNDWVLPMSATTGYVESNVIDMGSVQRLRINKHESLELTHGPTVQTYYNYNEYANRNILNMISACTSCHFPVNVFTNPTFTGTVTTEGTKGLHTGIPGWTVATSTSGHATNYSGWTHRDNSWCLTADSHTYNNTDGFYQNYSVLTQTGCFDASKQYYIRVFYDHDHKLKNADTAGYGQYGTYGDIYHHHKAGTNWSTNVDGIISPEAFYSWHRDGYTNTTNRGPLYPIQHFYWSGATDFAISGYQCRRNRLTKVEAYEVHQMDGHMQNMSFEMKIGDTLSACNSASYKKYLFNTWCKQDDTLTTNGEVSFQRGYGESYIEARFVKLKIWFNNDFKNL